MADIELRDYREADYAALVALWEATGVGNPERGDTAASIARTIEQGGRLLLLVSGARVLGSAWLTDDGRRLHVHHMAVSPELQGKGHGARLLDKAIAIGAEKKLQMKLEVHGENDRAIALYHKFGFAFIGDYRLMLRRKIGKD